MGDFGGGFTGNMDPAHSRYGVEDSAYDGRRGLRRHSGREYEEQGVPTSRDSGYGTGGQSGGYQTSGNDYDQLQNSGPGAYSDPRVGGSYGQRYDDPTGDHSGNYRSGADFYSDQRVYGVGGLDSPSAGTGRYGSGSAGSGQGTFGGTDQGLGYGETPRDEYGNPIGNFRDPNDPRFTNRDQSSADEYYQGPSGQSQKPPQKGGGGLMGKIKEAVGDIAERK